VQDNQQVAYLVPTTILAQQHYNNFVQRMKDFPIRVEMLSRFKTAKEQKLIINDISRGLVDIVIGTHRLLSKDVVYKELGLLIVDEEQRFGVKHKEVLKQIKADVDVLTLTATPIPRTLHMSSIGIRSMSILEEPPQERHPIQTYVMDYNEELVKDAIYRELSRNGQVYYVFNRVKGIDTIADRIRAMIPEASVEFAHGQMSERQLEHIMLDFVNGDIDVLVSTTIIETGLDIPNTNTIIVHDADRMGLSQLYQLRGRVGRSNRLAYAYLMYKKDKVLDETAEKRLQAIREFTEFGAGFKIAMRDLEIRGAGNILGTSQHGSMDTVGYDLYSKMLEHAINQLSDKPIEEEATMSIDVNIDAYIPTNYIENEVRKIESYKKIATIRHQEDYDEMIDELLDRYGEPPKSVVNLLQIALIKGKAIEAHIIDIKQQGFTYVVAVKSDAPIDPNKIPKLEKAYGKRLKFVLKGKPHFVFQIDMDDKRYALEQLKTLVTNIKGLEILEG
ncbi:MAG: helicase-related protein, partial [Vallitaleaceae bacterium]|jgi:transcription-repair coupling factor (superfamily II helicase)|nr:helicase-related protein [Vallitaleaceae bacterium]